MTNDPDLTRQKLPRGVMLNAYPDSIGERLADAVSMLRRPEFEGAFSLFYLLPTFFNSDLDRGFSIIDYDLNQELVSPGDLEALNELDIMCKLDLVLNHLSVRSPQFQDLLRRGEESPYRDFFVDWNAFWEEHGSPDENDVVMPDEEHLQKLFMRKPGLPVLRVRFPDGSHKLYWNTFYQSVSYGEVTPQDLIGIDGIRADTATDIVGSINHAIGAGKEPAELDLGPFSHCKDEIVAVVESKREYLGQMDLNARSELVWAFYDDTFRKLRDYGARIIRLDAFAYLHKAPGEPNFFNRPGTWDYLERLRGIAARHDLIIFPEIHAEYGSGLHEEVAGKGFPIYDFFLPGLLIDTLERGNNEALLRWVREILAKGIETINMLGCHDGIPVLDLKGKEMERQYRQGLLEDGHIEAIMARITERGGRVKNLFGSDGRKIAYYQVNATFFSALGEDEQKLCLARAIQMFMPGIPQVWYLDLFAGRNDYAAADQGGVAGHKEINRTNLSLADVEAGLERAVVQDQLALIRLRNRCPAFGGSLTIHSTPHHRLHLSWSLGDATATLEADLRTHAFTVSQRLGGVEEPVLSRP